MEFCNSFFSDGTKDYRKHSAKAGDLINIKLRAPKNNTSVLSLLSETDEVQMKFSESGPFYDYYSAEVVLTEQPLRYIFKIEADGELSYYTQNGVGTEADFSNAFVIFPGFSVPQWFSGAVMYQIFPDRFYDGDKSNNVENGEYVYANKTVESVHEWKSMPDGNLDVHRFFGGGIPGIRKKLDYIKELGVEAIYLNPIFVSPSNHKYDCQDYEHVDPHLTCIVKDANPEEQDRKYIIRTTERVNLEASNKYFAEFVKDVHEHGMKVILDGVFNHCGSFHKWMDREGYYAESGEAPGAYRDPDSPYREFFNFSNPEDCNSYEAWWGFETLPKLNYENSERLQEYICKIGAMWVSEPYCCDGWRLDVAADLGHSEEFNHKFWRRFRKAVKEANPNAVIIAEHYGDSSAWLDGTQWDTVMNYDAFMDPLSGFLTGVDKHSDNCSESLINNTEAFLNQLRLGLRWFSNESMYCAMNELSNHDHSRFMTRTSGKVGRVRELGWGAANEGNHPEVFEEAVVFQMTWPGCPTIYYGDEAGLCGFTDPDSRRTFPWGEEDERLLFLHRELGLIHKRLPVLKNGSVAPLVVEKGVFAFARFDRQHVCVTIINNNDEGKDMIIPLDVLDFDVTALVSLLITDASGVRRQAYIHQVKERKINIYVGPRTSVILKELNP